MENNQDTVPNCAECEVLFSVLEILESYRFQTEGFHHKS